MKHLANLIKKYRKSRVAQTAAFFLVLLIGIGGPYAYKHLDRPVVPALQGVGEEMRRTPDAWTKVEKDGSELLRDLRIEKVAAVGIAGSAVLVSTEDGGKYFVVDARGSFAAMVMADAKDPSKKPFQMVVLPNAKVGAADVSGDGLSTARDVMGLMLPLLVVAGLVLMARDEIFGGPKLVEKPTTKFADVIGAGEAKSAMKDIVAYLKEPSQFTEIGGRPPAGVLLLGGPGVGKTLLGRALAGEAGVPFIAMSGSDFSSKFYGAGIMKVKGAFELARKHAPCILFIDEIDGVSARSSTGGGAVESENNRIINQVLVEMDGFTKNEGVIVIGATNLAANLDPALLREGRFDRRITVEKPDMRDRSTTFEHYAKKLKLAGDIDYDQLARLAIGLSPASIAYVVNHAALVATRAGEKAVRMAHLIESLETSRIGELNGGQRSLSADERRYLAVHEAGHALTSALLRHGNVEKVTILPRGGALGVTLVTQNEDKKLMLESEIEKQIMMLLGGRNAELEVFEEASTGASHDLEEASRLALAMVSRYGFGNDGSIFSLAALPADQAAQQTNAAVAQAKLLLGEFNHQSQMLLLQNRPALDTLTQELLANETVDGARVLEIAGVQPMPAATA